MSQESNVRRKVLWQGPWSAFTFAGCSSFDILPLLFSHFLPFMFNSCVVSIFSYFADFVGCLCLNINHDLISMYPALIVEPLFEVTSIHCSTYMAKMEVQIKLLKTVHFSRITLILRLHCSL